MDYLETVGDRIVSVLSGRPLSVIRVRAGQRSVMQTTAFIKADRGGLVFIAAGAA